jgi:hypothetical protein
MLQNRSKKVLTAVGENVCLRPLKRNIFTALLANYFSMASWEILLQYDLLSFTLSTCPAKDEIHFLDTLTSNMHRQMCEPCQRRIPGYVIARASSAMWHSMQVLKPRQAPGSPSLKNVAPEVTFSSVPFC